MVNQGPRARLPSCPPQVQPRTRPAGSCPLLTSIPGLDHARAPLPLTAPARIIASQSSRSSGCLSARALLHCCPAHLDINRSGLISAQPVLRKTNLSLRHDPPGTPPRRLALTPHFKFNYFSKRFLYSSPPPSDDIGRIVRL